MEDINKRKVIVNIMLTNSYVDGLGYQENIMMKYQQKMGYDVFMVSFNPQDDQIIGRVDGKNAHIIWLKRLDYLGRYKGMGLFEGVEQTLVSLRPDIIFILDGQFLSLKKIIKYCDRNQNVRLYIDNHSDYYNTPINKFRRKFLYRYILGFWLRKSQRVVKKFWGVTPWRCEFLHEVYGIKNENIDLLVMGADDDAMDYDHREKIRHMIREKFDIGESDFVIVTGGKIDKAKNFAIIFEMIKTINNPSIKLLFFGKPDETMKSEIEEICEYENVRYAGWIGSDEVYSLFYAGDLAVFPGTHSVLWEQACACGLPGVFKDWPGMHHVDLGGNAIFLKLANTEELTETVNRIIADRDLYNNMRNIAETKCVPYFKYSRIAAEAIEENVGIPN